jgi:thioredoxin reductase
VITDRKQRTRVPGLFVAGDAAIDIHFVSVACAEGAKAAVAIHQELRAEDGY